MKNNQKEPKLTYALDSSGKMVHISNVVRGLSCNCRCPKCNESLVAKLGHEGGRQAHFAHHKGSNCHGSYMSALHKLAEQIIEEKKAVMAPAYKSIDKQKLSFEHVEVEKRVERKDLQPDLVGITSKGLNWFIEIRNTHEVDEAKRAKLIESNITCLEIDVRDQTLENLKSFLLESTESREWINNPIYDKMIEDSYRKKVSAIVKKIEAKPELDISKGDNIYLENLSISVSEDGLYANIKATSSNGVHYLFHIGSHEVLKKIRPTKECNELLVDVDKNQLFNGLFLERLYLYIPKKKTEAKIGDYKDIPQYEIRPNGEAVVHPQSNPSPKTLPFDRFWTTDELYTQIQSTSSFEIEKGLSAKIVKCDKTNSGILLLYKDLNRVRTCPFHIAIIYVSNGDLNSNIVADFTNIKAAQDSYNRRLSFMGEIANLLRSEGNGDNELPF